MSFSKVPSSYPILVVAWTTSVRALRDFSNKVALQLLVGHHIIILITRWLDFGS